MAVNNATFSVTNKCNSKCKICNIWKINDFSTEISLGQIYNLFDKKILQNIDTVSITGGEPFLRKDINEIIRLLKNKLPKLNRIFINTNATYIDKIIQSSFLCSSLFNETILSISLDGNKSIHNELRGIDNYDNVIKLLINSLNIRNVKTSLSMTLSKLNCNLENLNHVYSVAQKYNCMFSFRFADNSEIYYKNDDIKFKISKNQKQTVSKFISENCMNNEFLKVLKKYIDTGINDLIIDKNGTNQCLAGNNFVFIHPDGRITPCLYSNQVISDNGTMVDLGIHEPCPCCTDCAIYPILENNVKIKGR